jgi:hypothetical protein
MGLDLSDEREYAWLLVRSDTLTDDFIELWQMVPVRAGSILSAVIGYPLRFAILFGTLLVAGAVMLAIFIVATQLPVTIFVYVHPLLPEWAWLGLLGLTVLCLGGYLVYAMGLWLQAAAQEDAPSLGLSPGLPAGAKTPPVEPAPGWNRWQTLHVGHESSRNGLFAGSSIAIGIGLQCGAVVLGPRYFGGPVDTGWQWSLLFAEQLFNTMLLGIPSGLVPTLATIEPVAPMGKLLMTGIDIFYVAGVITMGMLVLSSAFKIRELFSGTTRDLADHLENFDISGSQHLMIHRVAVLRPLDETEVISLTKSAFLEWVEEETKT